MSHFNKTNKKPNVTLENVNIFQESFTSKVQTGLSKNKKYTAKRRPKIDQKLFNVQEKVYIIIILL